jgi:hypothetical protein
MASLRFEILSGASELRRTGVIPGTLAQPTLARPRTAYAL